MKLWEVLKALEENPKKVFDSTYWVKRHLLRVDENGFMHLDVYDISKKLINCELGGGNFNGNIHVNKMDWQEVKQPVTWQEALEAWANGGKVKCILHGKSFVYDHSKWGNMYSGDGYLCDSEITEGIWYIEN